MVTHEEFLTELNTERRITMLEAMTAEIRRETAEIRRETAEIRASNEDARKEHRSHQRFVLRVTASMVIAVVLTFSGIGYNVFSVNRSLAELTIKVDRIDDRLASVETDVAALQTRCCRAYGWSAADFHCSAQRGHHPVAQLLKSAHCGRRIKTTGCCGFSTSATVRPQHTCGFRHQSNPQSFFWPCGDYPPARVHCLHTT